MRLLTITETHTTHGSGSSVFVTPEWKADQANRSALYASICVGATGMALGGLIGRHYDRTITGGLIGLISGAVTGYVSGYTLTTQANSKLEDYTYFTFR